MEVALTGLVSLLVGFALLVAGRRLYWLFVGALGFIAGLQLASLLPQISDTAILIVGLILGIGLALLAILLQRIAVAIAGFLAGGFILTTLAARLGPELDVSPWVLYLIGGLVGVILVLILFNWALITLSSMAGAALILQGFSEELPAGGVIFVLLVLAGIIIQGYLIPLGLRRMRRR